jgi:hypothetical protein
MIFTLEGEGVSSMVLKTFSTIFQCYHVL